MSKTDMASRVESVSPVESVIEAAARSVTMGETGGEPLATWCVGLNGENLVFRDARCVHYPNASEPEALIVIGPVSMHVFEYHSVDYAYPRK